MHAKYIHNALALLVLAALCVACIPQEIPPEALKLSPESLKERQMQTRRFDTADEKKILSASAALLQDLGFNLDESETDLGVIVASKKRDATDGAEIAGAIILALFTGVVIPVSKDQHIRVCVVTNPVGEGRQSIAARVTFQRIVFDTYGKVKLCEPIIEPKIYQEFFDKLSQSVFLEAHNL